MLQTCCKPEDGVLSDLSCDCAEILLKAGSHPNHENVVEMLISDLMELGKKLDDENVRSDVVKKNSLFFIFW